MNFFAIFFEIFLPGSSMNGIRDQNFFQFFSAYHIQFWLEILPEWGFLVFWIFLLFFSEFSCRRRVWTEFGTKFFFLLFLGLSHPNLAKKKAGKRFFNFLNILQFISKFSSPCRVWTEFGTKIFFSLSRPPSHHFG